MKNFTHRFKEIIAEGLPGEDAHLKMAPLNRQRINQLSEHTLNEVRRSAVGIILHPINNTIHCLLIKRPMYEGVHSNQIAFPGGKMDPEDFNLENTARRECFEEIQLPFNQGELITELSEVYIPVSKFVVRPFVFFFDELPQLVPDKREVEQIISFDVFDLINDDIIKHVDMKFEQGFIRKNVPFFDLNGHVVWGATGMMLSELREIITKI